MLPYLPHNVALSQTLNEIILMCCRQPHIHWKKLSLFGYTAERLHGWVRCRSESFTHHHPQADLVVPPSSSAIPKGMASGEVEKEWHRRLAVEFGR